MLVHKKYLGPQSRYHCTTSVRLFVSGPVEAGAYITLLALARYHGSVELSYCIFERRLKIFAL